MWFFLGNVSLQRLEHRTRRRGKKCLLESHFPSLFQIISGFFGVADQNLITRRAGLSFPLLDLGLGGWLFGPFFLMFRLLWITSVVGLWTSGGSLRCWIWSTVDRKNGPLQWAWTIVRVRLLISSLEVRAILALVVVVPFPPSPKIVSQARWLHLVSQQMCTTNWKTIV